MLVYNVNIYIFSSPAYHNVFKKKSHTPFHKKQKRVHCVFYLITCALNSVGNGGVRQTGISLTRRGTKTWGETAAAN